MFKCKVLAISWLSWRVRPRSNCLRLLHDSFEPSGLRFAMLAYSNSVNALFLYRFYYTTLLLEFICPNIDGNYFTLDLFNSFTPLVYIGA